MAHSLVHSRQTRTASLTAISIRRGILQALPIGLCYFPVSFTLGVMASRSGFSPLEAIVMSFLCFSGSGESIALQMTTLHQPLLAICFTSGVINLRYFLYSLTLAPAVKDFSRSVRYVFALGMVDETFALLSSNFKKHKPRPAHFLAVNFTALSAWVLGRIAGYVAGNAMGDIKRFGMDFAVPSMFIVLLVLSIENRKGVILALAAAAGTLVLRFTPFSSWSIFISGVGCAAVAVILEERWKRSSH